MRSASVRIVAAAATLVVVMACSSSSKPTGPTGPRSPPAKEPYDHDATDIEPEDRDVIEHADSLTVLHLEPREGPRDESKPTGASQFHGYDVTNHADVQPAARKIVVELMTRTIKDADGRVAKCFNPRHGISAKKGALTVDLVICFECMQLYVYGQYPSRIPISTKHADKMEKVFVEQGAK